MNQQAFKDLKLFTKKNQIQSIDGDSVIEWLSHVTNQLVQKLNPTSQEDYDALLHYHLVKHYDLNEQAEAFLKYCLKDIKKLRDANRKREEYEKVMEEYHMILRQLISLEG